MEAVGKRLNSKGGAQAPHLFFREDGKALTLEAGEAWCHKWEATFKHEQSPAPRLPTPWHTYPILPGPGGITSGKQAKTTWTMAAKRIRKYTKKTA